MKTILISFLICVFSILSANGQNEITSIYPKLDTFQLHSRYVEAYKQNLLFLGNELWMQSEQKKRYDPHYIKIYDTCNRLLQEGIDFYDCKLGEIKTYLPSGQIQSIVSYKNFQGVSWDSLKSEDCNVIHGNQIVFDISGDTLYYETWNNNIFLEQVPQQGSTYECGTIATPNHTANE